MNDTLIVGTADRTSIHGDWSDHGDDTDGFYPARSEGSSRSGGRGGARTGLRVIVAVIIAMAVAGAGFAGWWLAAGPGTYSPTPDVVGLTFDQAGELLQAEGLSIAAAAEAYSEQTPPGSIISTDPPAGAGIRPGGTVAATVSLGPERYAVPDVRGTAPEIATEAIVAAGMATGGRVEVFDDAVPAGQVARTEPAIGDLVPPDTPIDLLISKGPEPVEIEDVTGRKQTVAVNRLEDAGLQVTTTEEFSDTIAQGRVISVSPSPGTTVDSGSTVALVVSKGPPPVEVPDLIDLRRNAAVDALERLGLRAQIDDGEFTRLNRVFDQSPSPGELVPRGSTVTLRIV